MLPADPKRLLNPPNGLRPPSDPGLSQSGFAAPLGLPPAPPPSGPELSTGVILQALRRRWLLALCMGLLGGALGVAGVWGLMPPRYTSTALVHLSSHAPRDVFGVADGEDDFAPYRQTQIAMLKGPSV